MAHVNTVQPEMPGNPGGLTVVFMGTPDFAIPSLHALAQSRHRVIAVVTAPDKPRGRGRQTSFSPVKSAAAGLGVPVLQPESLREEEFAATLRSFSADLFIVVAFRILPASVFTIPPLGTFNLHASLLPRYRGAAPINWALINGEKRSGVTTFLIREKVDTGNILLQRAIDIPPDMCAGELHDALASIGAELVVKTTDLLAAGGVTLTTQDDALATPAPKIFRETCRVDWTKSATDVHNFVRGLSPYPAAWTVHGDRTLKMYRTRILAHSRHGEPGTVFVSPSVLEVACGTGSIEILELQQEGKKVLETEEFLRGYAFTYGEKLQ